MSNHPHNGHRKRVKNAYIQNGADFFNEHQLVELLLFFGIPQGDVNPIAHHLIDRFGSIHAMLEASYDQLRDVDGVGEHTAVLIKLCGDLVKRCGLEAHPLKSVLKTTAEIGEFLKPRFWGAHDEVFLMVALNSKREVIEVSEISRGVPNSTPVNLELIRRRAILSGAAAIILAHNHPIGVALPSKADVEATAAISQTLKALGVVLYDHLIFAEGDYISMRDTPTLVGVFL